MVATLPSNSEGMDNSEGMGLIPEKERCQMPLRKKKKKRTQNIKWKKYCNKVNEDLNNGVHKTTTTTTTTTPKKKTKNPENNKGFYEKVEELESLFVAGGNIRWCSYRQRFSSSSNS